jgi:transketolase C-terminal domain/subunit
MRIVGVPHVYAENGPYEGLLEMYGLLPEQIAETVKELI